MPIKQTVTEDLTKEFNKAASKETQKTPESPKEPRLVPKRKFSIGPGISGQVQEMLAYVKEHNQQETTNEPETKPEAEKTNNLRELFQSKAKKGFAKAQFNQEAAQENENRLREKFNLAASKGALSKDFNLEAQKGFAKSQFNKAAERERGR